MANISKIKLPNNTTYNVKDNSGDLSEHNHYVADLVPISEKTFTDIYVATNNWANGTFFFGKIVPTDFNTVWWVHYIVDINVPSVAADSYHVYGDCYVGGHGSALNSYKCYYTVNTAGGVPFYYQVLYRATRAGVTNDYGHLLGLRLYSSTNATSTSYKRTVTYKILETHNCEFSFFDSATFYANCPGTGSTNYNGNSEYAYPYAGLQETGDSDQANYVSRIFYTYRYAAETLYRYQLCATTPDKKILPLSNGNNAPSVTTKTYTTKAFDPFQPIMFYSTANAKSAGVNMDNGVLCNQTLADFRYTFNWPLATSSSKFTMYEPVYLVCEPQSDGSVLLHTEEPLVQTEPTTEDGLIYKFLGYPYPDTYPFRAELDQYQICYWYKDGAFRQYYGPEATTSVAGLISNDDKAKLNKYPSTSTSQSGNFLKVNSSGNVEVSNITVDTALTQSELDTVLTGSATPASYYSVVNRNDIDAMTAKLVELNAPTRLTSGGEEGTTYGAPPLVLLHFSDIHGDSQRVQNIVNFKSYYADRINDIICTGDIVNYSVEDGLGFWTGVSGSEDILTCIGNHDSCMVNASDRTGSNWMKYTMSECYQMYMADNIASWGATYTSGKTYYYKDYTTQGVRLIVLDIMRNVSDSNQLTWFTSTLTSARTAGLHVIVAAHGHAHWRYMPYDTPWDTAKLAPGKVSSQDHYEYYPKKGYAYMGGEGATFEDASTASRGTNGTAGYPSNFGTAYMEAVQEFIDAGGCFVCWLHGHTHYKMFARLLYFPDQLDVSVAQAGCPPFANSYTNYREEDTRTEDDFELVAVDTTSKTLRIAQVGIDHDRYMRPWESISYDYGTHELMSPAEDQPTDLLFQGTINSSTTTLTLPNAMRYQQIVVVGKSGAASSDGRYSINSVRPITTSALTTSAVNYTLTGGSATFTFSVKYSGSNIVITYVSETTSGKGAITSIYGHM